ncbi:MAG: helix-turn-helix domain-containing protein [Bacteroidales bacterium]|nr:helix-turn-helix domain-containing protein [Bacteroidales bacterium]
MKIAVITLLTFIIVTVAFAQVVRNRKYQEMRDKKGAVSPYLLLSTALALLADLVCGTPRCGAYLIACLTMSLSGMSVLTSSIWNTDKARLWAGAISVCNVLLAVWRLICAEEVCGLLPATILLIMALCAVLFEAVMFMAAFVTRIKSVKTMMKTGTVWANVGLGVDAFYLLCGIVIVAIYFCICTVAGTSHGAYTAVAAFLLGMELAAYGYRILTDSMFVLWRKQERRIVESLKVTNVESASDMSRIDEVYKDIYERVVAYFEREKPFLDSELTINDLVKVLYSNKLYISKAISQFTGRNFCQFVNYYRIKYSTECFKANHDLKIHEMSSMSGFNSIVSFNMAFRLYMGENPSDWCRKEKGRFVKDKK